MPPRPLGPLRRAVRHLSRRARRRRLRDRRRLPGRPPDRGARLPRLHAVRHARGLDLAMAGDRDTGRDLDRHGTYRTRRLGRGRRGRRRRRAGRDRGRRPGRGRGQGRTGEPRPQRRPRRGHAARGIRPLRDVLTARHAR